MPSLTEVDLRHPFMYRDSLVVVSEHSLFLFMRRCRRSVAVFPRLICIVCFITIPRNSPKCTHARNSGAPIPIRSGNRELFQKKQRNLIYEMSAELPVYCLDGESLTPEMVSFSSRN